jgi:hypothetical protein
MSEKRVTAARLMDESWLRDRRSRCLAHPHFQIVDERLCVLLASTAPEDLEITAVWASRFDSACTSNARLQKPAAQCRCPRLLATNMAGDHRARAATDLRPDRPLKATPALGGLTCLVRPDTMLRVQTQAAPIEPSPQWRSHGQRVGVALRGAPGALLGELHHSVNVSVVRGSRTLVLSGRILLGGRSEPPAGAGRFGLPAGVRDQQTTRESISRHCWC